MKANRSSQWIPVLVGLVLLPTFVPGCGDDSTEPADDDGVSESTPTPEPDQDGDGYVALEDCDDTNASIHPEATELCDGIDNDCDGSVDEGFTLVPYYVDADQDGHGDPSTETTGCSIPTGYVDTGDDCDDTNPDVHPDAQEIVCNGLDEDCSSMANDHPDGDGDGYDQCEPGVSESDGLPVDCDDAMPTVHPSAEELCDERDNDCDGEVDEDLPLNTYYVDNDRDGFGDTASTVEACAPPTGYVDNADDCDDDDPTVSPGAVEFHNDGVDSDCDGYNDYVVTISDGGDPGYGGDGGPLDEASFQNPTAIVVDRTGIVYIADTGNHAIRRVDLDGTITTLIGDGEPGDLDGYASDARLNSPTGLATDGTNLYIADTGNHKVRKWTLKNDLVITVAGNGLSGFGEDGEVAVYASLNGPMDVAISSTQVLYIADTGNHVIRSVDLKKKTPTITTVAGQGGSSGYEGDGVSATDALLNSPQGVAVDTTGTMVYIADTGNHVIRKVERGVITLLAGTPNQAGYTGDRDNASTTFFDHPTCIDVAISTDVFVCDTGNNRIRQITPSQIVFLLAGNGSTEEGILEDNAAAVDLAAPQGLAFDSEGDMWIADTGHAWIRKLIW